jgi:GalNAc-alpha-(1->4)-GalNAc-alpha-(1->3)-diNAcBac-PP-undecaprenol alpha-1,4-N-acetyl-D-galactosaminyltransferase
MTGHGAERAAACLVNNFSKLGYEVVLMKLDNEKSFYELNSNIEIINLNINKASSNKFKAIKNNIKSILITRRAIKKVKPDVIMCFSITTIFLSVFSAIGTKIKVIGSEQSNPYYSLNGSLWKPAKKILSPLCDGFIFQTERAAAFYPKRVREKSIIIPNAIYNDDIYNVVIPEKKEKIVCSVGRLIELKGFDVLIRAFHKIHDRIPEYKLVIYGEGNYRGKLEHLINQLSLNDKVLLPGLTNHIEQKLVNAETFVLSSRHEGMPNTLLEAMALGLPCVSTNCEMGPAELIDNMKNGILVEVDNIEKMSEAILLTIKDKNIAKKLSDEAMKIRKTNHPSKISLLFSNYIESIVKIH